MIVCKACGQHNAKGEEFCTNCGRYLEWSGEHVDVPEPEAAPEVPPVEETPSPRPSFLSRIAATVIPSRRHAAALAPAAEANGAEQAAGTGDQLAHGAATAGGAGEVATLSAHPTAALEHTALVEPVAEQLSATATVEAHALVTTGAAIPGASTPGAPGMVGGVDLADESTNGGEVRGTALRKPNEVGRTQRRQRRNAPLVIPQSGSNMPLPGDIYCQHCNQFNSPSRVFCRRCGEQLVHADDEEPQYQSIPWWRRHLRRDVKIVAAGGRPGRWGRASSGGGASGRTMAILARVGAVVVVIGIALSFAGPYAQPLRKWYSNLYHGFVHKVDVTYTQEYAIGANATSSAPSHAAGLAVDDADNTYWQSVPGKHDGVGQSLTIVFSSPTTIDRLGFLSGAGPSQQAFLQQARPHSILVTYGTHQVTEQLANTNAFQHFDVRIAGVTSLRVKILSVYPSPVGHAVAITEIEFFQRS